LGRPPALVDSRVTRTGSRRAAAVLVLGMLLVAALAGASSQTSRGTSTLRAGLASATLSVAATLGILVLATSGAILIWALASRGRGQGDVDERERTPFWHRVAACAVLVLVVGVVAALLRKRPRPLQNALTPAGVARAQIRPPGKSAIHFVPAASISTIAVVAVLLVTLFAWSRVSAQRRRQGRSLSLIVLRGNEVIPVAQAGSVLAESLSSIRIPDPEEEPDPRKAVVAAYLAMTRAAADSGARRRDDETPAEFLQQLLESLESSREAARRLTSLFEAARYSSKAFEETRRSAAITALRQVRAELTFGMIGATR
jgi:hypothetical protein